VSVLLEAFWRSGSAREGRALDTAPDRRARRHTLTSEVGTRPAIHLRRCGCRPRRAQRRQGGRASPSTQQMPGSRSPRRTLGCGGTGRARAGCGSRTDRTSRRRSLARRQQPANRCRRRRRRRGAPRPCPSKTSRPTRARTAKPPSSVSDGWMRDTDRELSAALNNILGRFHTSQMVYQDRPLFY